MEQQEDMAVPPDASQASSRFPFEPVNGQVLFHREAARRDWLQERGNCLLGCREIDVEALSGGFERGCIVGVSSEQEYFGLLLGIQTIARLLVGDALQSDMGKDRPRVMLVTTLTMSALLPTIRAVLQDQAGLQCQDEQKARATAVACLEQIAISRVFDLEGLWEVLQEDLVTTDVPVSPGATRSETHPPNDEPIPEPPQDETKKAEFHATLPLPSPRRPRPPLTEIMDSDEDALPVSDDSSELSSPPPSTSSPHAVEAQARHQSPKPGFGPKFGLEMARGQPEEPHTAEQAPRRSISRTADVILVTHMSSLLASLFRTRAKSSAHSLLALLSSHLRHVSRSPDYGCPLIILLNATNSLEWEPEHPRRGWDGNFLTEIPSGGGGGGVINGENQRGPLDPTLRSIFHMSYNPAPNYPGMAEASGTAARCKKPVYGLIFTQLLDLHLLATLVPRAREDAELLCTNDKTSAVRYSWIVEVLLDELGVWNKDRGVAGILGARKCREQRWAAVEVRGTRIVDVYKHRE